MKAPSSSHPAADEQASLWAARLEGSSLSADERAALDTWLTEHPSHRTLLSQYCQFSADLEEQLPLLVAADLVTMPEQKAPRRSSKIIGFTAAAALAAAAAVVFLVRPHSSPAAFQNLATPVAQRQSVVLPDGTHVELNAQTSLAMESNGAERRVRLADGEAFFEVSKDPSRPFIVETPSGSVRVTGTKFDVHTEHGLPFEVTVVEGSVQVRPGELSGAQTSAPYSLGPGDHLSADPHGVSIQALSSSSVADTLAWRQGQAVFNDTPLREALARFARYHGRGITTAPEAANLKIGGRYDLDDIDGFFAAVEEVLPVRVTRDLSGTVHVGRRDQP